MIDLGHGPAERGETLALLKRLADFRLHARQLLFGLADFRARAGGMDHAPGIARIGAETVHCRRKAAHRTHEAQIERGIEDDAEQKGSDGGVKQEAAREGLQLPAQGGLVHDHVDQLVGITRRLGPDAQQAPRRREEDIDGIAQMGRPVRLAQIAFDETLPDRPAIENELVHTVADARHGNRVGAHEQGAHLVLAERPVGRHIGGQGGQVRGLGPVGHPLQAEAGGGREVDQRHADRDHADGHHEELARQAVHHGSHETAPPPRCAGGRLGRVWIRALTHDHSAQ